MYKRQLVGCIGTDGVCRDMKGLVAKAHALCEEGVTCYCYTGSYDVPVNTITKTIKSDLLLIDKVIGVGEIALSDHRSSQPTYEPVSYTHLKWYYFIGRINKAKFIRIS